MPVSGIPSSVAISITVILCVLSLCAITGNVSIFVAFFKSKKLRTWENAFHLNIAGLCVFLPCVAVSSLVGLMWWTDTTSGFYRAMCVTWQMSFGGLLVALACHTGIGVLRLIRVYRPSAILPRWPILVGLLASWVVGIIHGIHVIVINAGTVFKQQCGYTQYLSGSSAIKVAYGLIAAMLIVLLVTYTAVLVKVRNSVRVDPVAVPAAIIIVEANQDQEASHSSFAPQTAKYIIKSNLILLCTFLLCCLSSFVALQIGEHVKMADEYRLFLFIIAYAFTVVNPVIYNFRYNEMRKCWARAFRFMRSTPNIPG